MKAFRKMAATANGSPVGFPEFDSFSDGYHSLVGRRLGRAVREKAVFDALRDLA